MFYTDLHNFDSRFWQLNGNLRKAIAISFQMCYHVHGLRNETQMLKFERMS